MVTSCTTSVGARRGFDHGSHLPQPGQRGLLAHVLFHADPGAEIVKDARDLRSPPMRIPDGQMDRKQHAITPC
jgi:hypothetical protein